MSGRFPFAFPVPSRSRPGPSREASTSPRPLWPHSVPIPASLRAPRGDRKRTQVPRRGTCKGVLPGCGTDGFTRSDGWRSRSRSRMRSRGAGRRAGRSEGTGGGRGWGVTPTTSQPTTTPRAPGRAAPRRHARSTGSEPGGAGPGEVALSGVLGPARLLESKRPPPACPPRAIPSTRPGPIPESSRQLSRASRPASTTVPHPAKRTFATLSIAMPDPLIRPTTSGHRPDHDQPHHQRATWMTPR